MSRVSLLEKIYQKNLTPLEFNYDKLIAPPICALFTQQDIEQLYKIATSNRYNGNINKKYKLIDEVMIRRGFKKAHAGTNRVVYNFLEDTSFVAKVAVDKVGLRDSPAEFKNQEFFKPFCCKIFEVHPSGVLGIVERVNPITSLEEFASVADDIFNMITTKIIGKYVVDDIGTSKFLNFGLRMNGFGPVLLDFPYAYELDGGKLQCLNDIETPNGIIKCCGEIDYDVGFNYLQCTKCGKIYKARDLTREDAKDLLKIIDDNKNRRIKVMAKLRIVDGKGNVILDDYSSTKTYVTKEEYDAYAKTPKKYSEGTPITRSVVSKVTHKRKRYNNNKNNQMYYSDFAMKTFGNMNGMGYPNPNIDNSVKLENKPFNDKFNVTKVDNTVDISNVTSEKIEPLVLNKSDRSVVYKSTDAITGESNIHNNTNNVDQEITESSVDTFIIENDNTEECVDDIHDANFELENEEEIADVLEATDVSDNILENITAEELTNKINSLSHYEETDYSNYIPPEEELEENNDNEEEIDMDEYKRRFKIKKVKIVSHNDEDMSDY